jgi:hypothetical protein
MLAAVERAVVDPIPMKFDVVVEARMNEKQLGGLRQAITSRRRLAVAV